MPGFDIRNGYAFCHPDPTATPSSVSHFSPSNTVETARKYRYRLEILEPLDEDFLLLYAYKITRPIIEFDTIVIHNGQGEIYRPGKNRWQPIEISFYERVYGTFENAGTPDATGGHNQAAKLIYDWWANSVLNINNSLHGPANGYQKPAEVAMLDGLGNPIWTYYLVNCWPSKVTPSDLSYTMTEIADITVTLTYDRALEKERRI